MNGTKRPRARAARLLGGLAALALALLAPRAAASVPRAGDLPVPGDSFSASAIESPPGVAPLSEGLDLAALERALIPDADVVEAPRFSLGDVVLEETEHEQRFGFGPMQLVDVEALRGPPGSYPETRIRAFAFLGSTLIGVSRGVSLELLPGYERIGLGLAEGDVVNLYAYVGLQPHAAVDPMGEAAFLAPLAAAGVSGVASVAIGFVASCVLDDCNYTMKDAVVDFALGAATFGIGTATSGIARTGARWGARVAADAVLGVGSEAARREWKNEDYTTQELVTGAAMNFAIGEAGSLAGRHFRKGYERLKRSYRFDVDFGVMGSLGGGVQVRRRVGPDVYAALPPHPSDASVLGGYRGRHYAASRHSGLAEMPADWDVHHTYMQRWKDSASPYHYLAVGRDIDSPSLTRGVMGDRYKRGMFLGGKPLQVMNPDGRIRFTSVHKEIDREIRAFVGGKPTRTQYEEYRRYLNWRWGHTFWESGAGR